MKNNENLFSDFVVLAAIAGITKAFSESVKEQNNKSKKSNDEKKCECKCKNQQDFNKEMLGKVRKCKDILCLKTLDRDKKIYEVIEDMETKLMTLLSIQESETDKSNTINPCQYTEKHSKKLENEKILDEISKCQELVNRYNSDADEQRFYSIKYKLDHIKENLSQIE